jgi:DNA repair protein RecO
LNSAVEDHALLLQRTPLGDHEAIVALLTRDHGSIRAVVSVAPSKTQTRILEPFHSLFVELVPRRGELWRLRSSRIEIMRDAGRWDLDRLEFAGECCRWVRALTPASTPESELFEALDLAMASLDRSTGDLPSRRIGARFVFTMLSTLGYPPELSRCVRCGEARPHGKAGVLRASVGGLLCAKCRRVERAAQGDVQLAGHVLDSIGKTGADAIDDPAIDDDAIVAWFGWLTLVVAHRLDHVGSKVAR